MFALPPCMSIASICCRCRHCRFVDCLNQENVVQISVQQVTFHRVDRDGSPNMISIYATLLIRAVSFEKMFQR